MPCLPSIFAATTALVAAAGCANYGMQKAFGAGTEGRNHDLSHLSIARVTDLGPLHESPDILARDGGLSGVFDGRSVWLFGDTAFRLRDSGNVGWLSNSFAWTRDFDARNGIEFTYPTAPGGEPRPLLPDSDVEHEFNLAHAPQNCALPPCGERFALWPQATVADPARARMLIFFGKIRTESGSFKLTWVGQSVAVWQDFGVAPVRAAENGSGMMFHDVTKAFGNAAVVSGDDLYVYGCGAGVDHTERCRLARVRLESVLDLREWRYYAGGGRWSRAPEDAVPVLGANDILSVAYNPHLSQYLAVYTPPLTNQVMMRTSERPEGPWSEAVVAFPTRTPKSLWVYDARAHPEYEREGGRIQYVTYSLATGDFRSEVRLVEVALGG